MGRIYGVPMGSLWGWMYGRDLWGPYGKDLWEGSVGSPMGRICGVPTGSLWDPYGKVLWGPYGRIYGVLMGSLRAGSMGSLRAGSMGSLWEGSVGRIYGVPYGQDLWGPLWEGSVGSLWGPYGVPMGSGPAGLLPAARHVRCRAGLYPVHTGGGGSCPLSGAAAPPPFRPSSPITELPGAAGDGWSGAVPISGFIKSPLSQRRLTQDSVELHCEAVGNPIPEIQWWFEGNEPNETSAQLWDGAWQDRVQINATYNLHSTSTIIIANLTSEDSGTYECRASNDPDRNHLSKSPKVKWIRSQANVLVIERPVITGQYISSAGKVILSCNMSAPPTPIKGHKWMLGDKTLKTEESNSNSYISYTIEGKVEDHSGVYECIYETNPVAKGNVSIEVPPQVVAYKKSEHGNEGDTGVMICKSPSYPPVDTWTWFKSDQGPIVNGTGRYIIKSSGNKTELRILKLSIEQDTGDYHCNGTNLKGPGSATVNLRVRSRLAALWPFLGIVAEVLVLVTIIFIYEKRRKPDEVLDDDDGGSAPLKSNATNHKDKNVRQRNAN